MAQDSYQRPAISVTNVDFNETSRCSLHSVPLLQKSVLYYIHDLLYVPPPSCKKKLSSVCVQIASCQFVVPFRPSDSSPEAELLFSPTHAWCIGSRVPFPNYPPQPLRVETHLLPHPYLSFPPPNPLPWNSLSPSGRSCSSHSVTNICTLFLC